MRWERWGQGEDDIADDAVGREVVNDVDGEFGEGERGRLRDARICFGNCCMLMKERFNEFECKDGME